MFLKLFFQAFSKAKQEAKEEQIKLDIRKRLVSKMLDYDLLHEIVNQAKTGTQIKLILQDGTTMIITQELPSSAADIDPRVNALF